MSELYGSLYANYKFYARQEELQNEFSMICSFLIGTETGVTNSRTRREHYCSVNGVVLPPIQKKVCLKINSIGLVESDGYSISHGRHRN